MREFRENTLNLLIEDFNRAVTKVINRNNAFEAAGNISIYDQKIMLVDLGRIQGKAQIILKALPDGDNKRVSIKSKTEILRPIFDKFVGRENSLFL